MILWQNITTEFVRDGSLRDIYVTPACLEDWRRFYLLLISFPGNDFSINGVTTTAPAAVDEIFDLQLFSQALLCVRVETLVINIHFFTTEEIEADFDPAEVASETEFAALLGFVRRVGDAVQKPILVTPENLPTHPFITYSPATGEFRQLQITG
jgi:hypothetical protein